MARRSPRTAYARWSHASSRSAPSSGSLRATANPVIGVKKPTKETTRDRVLTDDEIRRLWDACATQNAYVCAWFRLRLVTAQRGGELLQMRWQDIDPKSHFWTIPGEFVKNAHGHRVLSERDRAQDSGRRARARSPRKRSGCFRSRSWVITNTSAVVWRRARAPISSWSRRQPGRPAIAVDIRGHDLRRTAASLMASGGVPRFVISRILNHSEEKDITSVYDRYSYDAEKKAAMEFWNRQLAAVLKGKSALSVRRFASAVGAVS